MSSGMSCDSGELCDTNELARIFHHNLPTPDLIRDSLSAYNSSSVAISSFMLLP